MPKVNVSFYVITSPCGNYGLHFDFDLVYCQLALHSCLSSQLLLPPCTQLMGNCSSSSSNCRRSTAEAKVFMACPLHLISSITEGEKMAKTAGYVRHVQTQSSSCEAKVQLVRGIRKVSEQRAKLSADCSSTVIVISGLRRKGERKENEIEEEWQREGETTAGCSSPSIHKPFRAH